MTRKDYEIIAKGFHACQPGNNTKLDYAIWLRTLHNVASQLQIVYPKFDKNKFMLACGHF